MTIEEAVQEKWIYAGKWVNKGRLCDRWLGPEGREMVYQKFPAQIVGGIYDVKVERSGDNATVYGAPKWTGDRIDDPVTLTQLVKDDTAQRIIHTQMRREVKEGDRDPLDDALYDLKKYMRACRTTQERDAVLATIIRRLSDAW